MAHLRNRSISPIVSKCLWTLLFFAYFFAFAPLNAESYRSFVHKHVSLEHPAVYQVTVEEDEEYLFVGLESPNRTLIEINYFDNADVELEEMVEYVIQETMAIPGAQPDKLTVDVTDISANLAGAQRQGKQIFVKAKSLFDRSKFQAAIYRIGTDQGTYIIVEERRNKHIEKDRSIVESILSSIQI